MGFGSDLPGPPGPLGTGQSVQKTTPFDSGLMCNDEFSGTPTLWIFNVAMERSTMLLIGKPSISMGKKIHGYVDNHRVDVAARVKKHEWLLGCKANKFSWDLTYHFADSSNI